MTLVDDVRTDLAAAGMAPSAAAVAAAIRRRGAVLGDADVSLMVRRLRSDLVGLGPLQILLDDGEVSDVLVNGPDEVWVDRGRGLVRADVRFPDETSVRALAQRLSGAAGRRLDEAAPFVDARLPQGLRLHAALPPIAVPGTLISIRVPARRSFDLDELAASGSVPTWGLPWLRLIVSRRLAFLVSGGTGTGKTTVLAALLGSVDPSHRILLVEDSGELAPRHPHVVRLQARPSNIEGAGQVGLSELVRQALRMRPDRLVVGEVRGAEVVDLLAALNTGHEGGCGTVHANSADRVPARMEALGVAAGLGRQALHSQLAAGLDVVIHLVRDEDGQRRVSGVGAVTRGDDGLVRIVPALRFFPGHSAEQGSMAEAGSAASMPDAQPVRRWPDVTAGAKAAAFGTTGATASTDVAEGGRGPGLTILRRLLDGSGAA